MDTALYRTFFELEDRHWWFGARRQIVEKVLRRFVKKTSGAVLEAGCGTGGNLEMLSKFGRIHAFELDEDARTMANTRALCEVRSGALPDEMPFSEAFDLIAMLDVLEHIADDKGTLHVLHQHLNTGGILALTVPAYQWLWSHHDEVNHHKRRYTRQELVQKVREAGFSVHFASYFNIFLFPMVLAVRAVHNILGKKTDSDLEMPAPWLNRALQGIFGAERYFLPSLRFPCGVSIILIAEKM
jgi:SAM-dependent methyltransferase